MMEVQQVLDHLSHPKGRNKRIYFILYIDFKPGYFLRAGKGGSANTIFFGQKLHDNECYIMIMSMYIHNMYNNPPEKMN